MLRTILVVFAVFAATAGCDAPEAKHKAAGNLHFKQGQWAEARDEYQKAVDANEKDPGGHILLGNALIELADYDGARKAYERALELDPSAPEAHRGLAVLITHGAKRCEPAAVAEFLLHIDAVITSNERDRNALISRAKVLSECASRQEPEAFKKAQREAEELLRKALPMDDTDPRTLYQLALVYARKNDVPTALRVVERIDKVAPDKGFGPYTRAVVYLTAGDEDSAYQALRDLLKSGAVTPEELKKAPELEPLFGTERFEALLSEAGQKG